MLILAALILFTVADYAPVMAQGASAQDVTRAVRERRKAIPQAGKRQRVPVPKPRP